MTNTDRFDKQRIANSLDEPVEEARALAEKLGLEPYPVNYWIVDYEEMNELIAYDGFQHRYPHWRWGMKYDKQRKKDRYAGGRVFEIVNNDNPSHAFLQESNDLADQKAVITHVEAHSDFFANNDWYGMFADTRNAAAMLERHARSIHEIMSDPEIDRASVERWIDHALTLEDNVDQHQEYTPDYLEAADGPTPEEDLPADVDDQLEELDLTEEVKRQVFDEEWLEGQRDDDGHVTFPEDPEKDLIAFLRAYGKAYDDDADKAVEMEPWQKDILEMIRAEAYYFAPQKMTKVLNEGWASYFESTMMTDEGFAGDDEFLNYADHMAAVLGAPGLNPYKLGHQLWNYVENTTNRREVVERLVRVDGITWRNFEEAVDYETVLSTLDPPEALTSISSDNLDAVADLPDEYVDRDALERARDGAVDVDAYPWKVLSYEGLARRNYSLVKPQHRGFLPSIGGSELEQIGRYVFETDRYDTVEEALADVDYAAGWDRMREIRESHNDVTFLDRFLTEEFVEDNDYFTYEFSRATGQNRVASTDYQDVKQKLLLQFTNFGKPTIAVYDGNYGNRNELLLGHQYNGIELDVPQAKRVLERVFELWGRPVNLMTIVKELDDHDVEVAKRRGREPEPEEQGRLIRYDGDSFSEEDLPWEEVEHLAADDVDYDTRPDDWLA